MSNIDTSAPTDFEREFSRAFTEDHDSDIKIYRVEKRGSKTIHKFLRRYEDHIPTHEEIGSEFGGGRFKLYTTDAEGKDLIQPVYVDEIWDEKRKRSAQGESPPGLTPADIERIIINCQPKQKDPLETFLKAAEVFGPMITGLFTKAASAAPTPPAAEGFEQLTEVFISGLKRMGDHMIKNQMASARPSESAQVVTKTEVPEGTPLQYIDKIKDVLEIVREFGSDFLEAKGLKEKIMKKRILKSDEMLEAKEDPNLASAIYTAACMDPQIGEEKAKTLFTKIGFDVEQTPEPQTTG